LYYIIQTPILLYLELSDFLPANPNFGFFVDGTYFHILEKNQVGYAIKDRYKLLPGAKSA
jgi:hypothetical protein